MSRRVCLIILDGCGVGAMPDAADFGDAGSNTLGHVAAAFPEGMELPALGDLGLGNIVEIRGVPKTAEAAGAYGKAAEKSPAKDTTLGHWEIAGVIADQAFPTYPEGFPAEVMDRFVEETGVPGYLANIPASGTVIIEEHGAEHIETKKPIVYTSGDSVFQIACHEDVYPLEELYTICEKARAILQGEHRVGRVIARPFVGEPGSFKRTSGRHDYSVEPLGETICDKLAASGRRVEGVGKIKDIFAGRGITHSTKTASNAEGMKVTLERWNEIDEEALLFVNLVDTDMLFGHRNDPPGFRAALEEFDEWLPSMVEALGEEDLLIITADHGIDPTTPSTDHSREYVPILVAGPSVKGGVDLETRETFADIAATIGEFFGIDSVEHGTSFLSDVWQG